MPNQLARTYTQYTPEFRTDALDLIRRGDRSFPQLSRDLGVNLWTLRSWWRDEMARKRRKKATGPAPTGSPRSASAAETPEEQVARLQTENARLHRKVEQLEMDREILKKAAAFFAKESE